MSVNPNDEEILTKRKFKSALRNEQYVLALQLLSEQPFLLRCDSPGHCSMIENVINDGNADIVKYVVSRRKEELNSAGTGTNFYPLEVACSRGCLEVVDYLLKEGAKPDLGRTLISAINSRGPDRVQIIESLISNGVNVNRVFAMFGSRKNVRTALDFAQGDKELEALLKRHNARTAKAILSENPDVEIVDAD